MLFCKRILLFVLLVILTSCEEEGTQESLADIPPTAQATIVEYLWSLCDPNLSGTYCSTYAEYVGYRTSHPNWTWHDYEVVNPLFKYLNQETFEYLYDQHVQWRDILISYEDWKRQYDSCQSALAVALPKLRPSVSSKYKTPVFCVNTLQGFAAWLICQLFLSNSRVQMTPIMTGTSSNTSCNLKSQSSNRFLRKRALLISLDLTASKSNR